MMRRKRVVKGLCLFIRVLVFISLVWSTLELREVNYPERTWHVYGIVLTCYLCTFVLEKFSNILIESELHNLLILLIQSINGIVKIFIILALIGLVVVQSSYKFATPLAICNIIACIGYAEEQGFRLVYWFEDNENQ